MKPQPPEIDADMMACLVLRKTIMFFVHLVVGLLLYVLVLAINETFGWRGVNGIYYYITAGIVALAILFLTIKGWLPGTNAAIEIPFSEKQLILASNVLSLIAMLTTYVDKTHAFAHVVAGAFTLFFILFFITKSFVLRRLCWPVLLGMIFPVLHFILSFL